MTDGWRIGISLNWSLHYGQQVVAGFNACADEIGGMETIILPPQTVVEKGLFARQRLDAVVADLCSDEDLSRINHPILDLAGAKPRQSTPRIHTDNEEVGSAVAEHFHTRGFAQTAVIAAKGRAYAEERVAGWGHYTKAHGRSESPVFWIDAEALDAELGEIHEQLMSLPTPCGIFATNDILAAHVWRFARKHKRRIPEDWSLVGVDDDTVIRNLHRIELTSVAQDEFSIGWIACGAMKRWLKTGQVPQSRLVPPKGIIHRKSTETYPIEDVTVAHAVRWMHENFHRTSSLNSFIEEQTMSRRTFERRFRTVLGRSPHAELKRIRLERAKSLLAQTSLSLLDVAEKVGYAEQSELSRDFRKHFGQTPRDWRGRFRS